MANLHVAEFQGLGLGDQSTDTLSASADALNATQVVALSGSSAASAAFQPTTRWLKLTAGAACSIAIGTAPIAATGGWFLNTGETVWVRVPAQNFGSTYKVAAITDTL